MSLVLGNVLGFDGSISLGKKNFGLAMFLVFWRFLGFSLSFLLPTCVVVFFISFPFPPSSLTFLFFYVYVILPFSMPFTHFVFIPLPSCGYCSCFVFLSVCRGIRAFQECNRCDGKGAKFVGECDGSVCLLD